MIKLANVVATYPGRRTVDLVFMESGLRAANVQVMCEAISSDAGSWNLPQASPPASELTAAALPAKGRAMVAVVAMVGIRPIVLGFLHPFGGQVAFDQQNRAIFRSPSGSYSTFAPDGSIELYHASGAYFRIGAGGHEDLTPLAGDGAWSIPAAAAPQITLETSGFSLVVEPGGNTTLTTSGTLAASVQGAASVESSTSVAVTAPAIKVGSAGGSYQTLATEAFVLDVFNAHTHTGNGAGAATSAPNQLSSSISNALTSTLTAT